MQKLMLLCWLGLVLGMTSARAQIQRGDMAYQADFNAPTALQDWAGAQEAASLEADPNGGQAVKVSQALDKGVGSPKISVSLPLEKLRGTRLICTAQVKAANVAQPPHAYNGIKFMLHIVGPEGESWPQQDNVFGTFDWKSVEFTATVPANAQKVELILGLEATTGTAWFDDVALKVLSRNAVRPAHPPVGPVYKGHNLPRLRGMMINPKLSEGDLHVLGSWKVNHIRWQLAWFDSPADEGGKADLDRYDTWLESALAHLDEILPVCEKLGIKVLIDLHSPPGGRNTQNECNLFKDKHLQEHFLQAWDKIVRRYKGKDAVWGYDFLNEPVEGIVPDGVMNWQELVTQAAKNVRALDAKHALIVEPAPWASPASLEGFTPLAVPGVVYSVHMYEPHTFTHQGVHGQPLGFSYPGEIDGKQWDKAQIRRVLQPVIDFQHDFNVHIYIGEFSAIRWAPNESAYNYLRDCIEVFEENNWDWAYHAFREWDGWSVEYGSDPKATKPSATSTHRQQLLQSWFAKNNLASPVKVSPVKTSPVKRSMRF